MALRVYKRTRVVKILKWLNPEVNLLLWQELSEDSLKLDTCLQGCQCELDHCTLACPKDCEVHCQKEKDDYKKWLNDVHYVRKFEPPCVKAVNWKKSWVMDQQGRLRGPYTYQSWLKYGFWALDMFHDTGKDKASCFWHQVYFRNEQDYYGGSYNHFYPLHVIMIRKMEGLEEKHLAANNVSRGYDVYHNIQPIDQEEAVKIRNAGSLFTTPEPHVENLKHFHKIRKRPLEAELHQWEAEDKKAKKDFVRKNAKKVRNWYPEPEGQNLTKEEAQEEADRRFNLWYQKTRNVPLFIPKRSKKILPPAFPTKKEFQQKYHKFNIKTIENWLKTGAIFLLQDGQTPDMVVPAIYANMEKKGRMCVDGGWIKQIEAYSVKCKLEDLPKALMALRISVVMTKCDDKVILTLRPLEAE